jgi:hypothetical protein
LAEKPHQGLATLQVVQTAEAGKLVQAVEKKFKLVHQGRPAYTLRIDGSMQVVKESDFKEDRGKEQHVVRELRAILEFLQNRRSELEGKESCRIVFFCLEDKIFCYSMLSEERI